MAFECRVASGLKRRYNIRMDKMMTRRTMVRTACAGIGAAAGIATRSARAAAPANATAFALCGDESHNSDYIRTALTATLVERRRAVDRLHRSGKAPHLRQSAEIQDPHHVSRWPPLQQRLLAPGLLERKDRTRSSACRPSSARSAPASASWMTQEQGKGDQAVGFRRRRAVGFPQQQRGLDFE